MIRVIFFSCSFLLEDLLTTPCILKRLLHRKPCYIELNWQNHHHSLAWSSHGRGIDPTPHVGMPKRANKLEEINLTNVRFGASFIHNAWFCKWFHLCATHIFAQAIVFCSFHPSLERRLLKTHAFTNEWSWRCGPSCWVYGHLGFPDFVESCVFGTNAL
jgi:hypothetical protein